MVKEQIERLKKSSRLQTSHQVVEFERAIAHLSAEGNLDIHDVEQLYLVFDDECEDYGVMTGLLHLIEDQQPEIMISALVSSIPLLSNKGVFWLESIVTRLLNSETHYPLFRARYYQLSMQEKQALTPLLKTIVSEAQEPSSTRAESLIALQN